eukprot:scaffold1785_cov247-Pinguiococcus_pyrenoidosus.AAC.15
MQVALDELQEVLTEGIADCLRRAEQEGVLDPPYYRLPFWMTNLQRLDNADLEDGDGDGDDGGDNDNDEEDEEDEEEEEEGDNITTSGEMDGDEAQGTPTMPPLSLEVNPLRILADHLAAYRQRKKQALRQHHERAEEQQEE